MLVMQTNGNLRYQSCMKDSKPKWVNSDYIQYGVNLLRLGGPVAHYK